MDLGVILRKRLEDACQRFRNCAVMKAGEVAAPPEPLPYEIDNLAHPNLFENIGWLQIAGHAGEQVIVGCGVLALEERWRPEDWKTAQRFGCWWWDSLNCICHDNNSFVIFGVISIDLMET